MSKTLDQHVAHSQIIKDFMQHPGMTLLVETLNKKVDFKKQAWLNAKNAVEAEEHRQTARVYAALMGILNEFVAYGAQAEKALLASKSHETVSQDQVSKGQ